MSELPRYVDGDLTVWGLLMEYYAPRKLLGKSKETMRLYGVTIRKFGRFLSRPAMMADLNDETVGKFIQGQFDSGTVRPATIAKDATQLLVLWRYANRRGMGPSWPEIGVPDAPENPPEAFSREEVRKLLTACDTAEGMLGDVPAKLFWACLVRIILDTGERVGAVRQIQWSDLRGEWLTVRAELRKGKKKPKQFKLRASTLAKLDELREYSIGGDVFPWPYRHEYLWQLYGKVLESAGLPNSRRYKLHMLRRTVATWFEAAGGDATQLLGHSARRVTEKYLDERQIERVGPADLLPEIE